MVLISYLRITHRWILMTHGLLSTPISLSLSVNKGTLMKSTLSLLSGDTFTFQVFVDTFLCPLFVRLLSIIIFVSRSPSFFHPETYRINHLILQLHHFRISPSLSLSTVLRSLRWYRSSTSHNVLTLKYYVH